MSESTSSEITSRGPEFGEEALRNVETFDDAIALAMQEVGDIASADNALGDGFALLDNKDTLIGKPLLFLSWSFNNGDFGPFVSAHVVARVDSGGANKVIINDGSTGIYAQLEAYTKRTGKQGGLLSRKGLRRSDYMYTDEKGQERPASTHYIDTSA
jgi:hypothetical protein